MGFRFHQRIKLGKGAWINVSKTGVSLSVGGQGLTSNLSRRGINFTLSAPGTGLSYRKRLMKFGGSKPQSRPTTSAGAKSRAQEQLARRQNLEHTRSVHQNFELMQAELLNFWREQIRLLSAQDYLNAATMVPFLDEKKPPKKYDPCKVAGPSPTEPTENRVRRELLRSVESKVLDSTPIPWPFLIAMLTTAFVLSLPAFLVFSWMIFSLPAFMILFVSLAYLGYRAVKNWWLIDHKKSINQTVEQNFKSVYQHAKESHQVELKEYKKSSANKIALAEEEYLERLAAYDREEKEWNAIEHERTAWARGVLAGDPQHVEKSIIDSFAELILPFESALECYVSSNGETACLNLDLPEIEDCISTFSIGADKRGNPRKVKRDIQIRYQEYQNLVYGFVLLSICTAFSAAPTVGRIVVGAYTQRGRTFADNYILSAECRGEDLPNIQDLPLVIPEQFLVSIGTKCRFNHNGRFERVPIPDWESYL